MSTPLQPARTLLFALACASLLTACATDPTTKSPTKSRRVQSGTHSPVIQSLTLTDKPTATTPSTAIDLTYPNGADIKARFESSDFSITDTSGTPEPGTGITIKDGPVFIKASKLPVVRAAAPRFWRIIRRRKVSVGAEGTEFLVQATDQKDTKRTLIAKVHMLTGTSVLIETPDSEAKLTAPDSQAYVYVDEKDFHTIEILKNPDQALKDLADRLAKLP